MKKEVEVKSQQELNDVCTKGDIAVVREGAYEVYGSSQVRAYGSSQVSGLADSSQVTAYDSSQVRAYGSSQVRAYGSSQVTAYDSSQVRAYDSSQVRAYDSSQVRAYGSSQVTAYGSSQVTASKTDRRGHHVLLVANPHAAFSGRSRRRPTPAHRRGEGRRERDAPPPPPPYGLQWNPQGEPNPGPIWPSAWNDEIFPVALLDWPQATAGTPQSAFSRRRPQNVTAIKQHPAQVFAGSDLFHSSTPNRFSRNCWRRAKSSTSSSCWKGQDRRDRAGPDGMIRLALRQLRKSPGFAITARRTIALGIGANTAIFTLVHAILMKSLPVTLPGCCIGVGQGRLLCEQYVDERRRWQEIKKNCVSYC